MPSIFISYRRSDSQADVGRIYDRLVAHFGKAAIFKDVDDIPPGVDFRQYLNQTLNQCQVLLAVIGPTWLHTTDNQGRRRLDNPGDWVRLEIEEALKRQNVLVVPLLVGHATMPRVDELPTGLQDLAYRNSREARPDPDFHKDMGRLINGLEQYFAQWSQTSPPSSPQPKPVNAPLPEPDSYADNLVLAQPIPLTRQRFLAWFGMGGVSLFGAIALNQLFRGGNASNSASSNGWGNPSTDSGWGTADNPGSESNAEGWGTAEPTSSVDFSRLEDLLRAGNWEAADQETVAVMLSSANQPTTGWSGVELNTESIQHLSCDVLQRIDQLWVEASNSQFGFSIQQKIFVEHCGGLSGTEVEQDAFRCFRRQVGWGDVWDTDPIERQVTYDTRSPKGHLPWQFLCGGSPYCDGSLDELRLYAALLLKLAACEIGELPQG